MTTIRLLIVLALLALLLACGGGETALQGYAAPADQRGLQGYAAPVEQAPTPAALVGFTERMP